MHDGLQLRVFRTLVELDAIRPAWEDLLSVYEAATTFCSWEWLSSWWKCFGNEQDLLALAVYDSGLLVGLAAFSVSTERLGPFRLRTLRLMGDGSGDSDNLDLPVRPGYEPRFSRALIQFLKEHRREWDVCRLNTLPLDSGVANQLAEMARLSQWTLIQTETPASAVQLPTTWNEYLQTLSSEDAKNLARYARRLEKRYSVEAYRCSDETQLPRVLESLFDLHQRRWAELGQLGTLHCPQRREFYRLLSAALLKKKNLELWVMELDGEISAVQFAFRTRDRVFQLQEGYDPRRSSDRVGFVLRGTALRQFIAENVRVYDFLGGEDAHKLRWGARTVCYRNWHFARQITLASALLWSAEKATKVKQALRQMLSPSVWRVLRSVRSKMRKLISTERVSATGAPEARKGAAEDLPRLNVRSPALE